MKKIKTVLTAIAMLLVVSSFASDGSKVSAKVQAAFQHDFSQATQVNWEAISDFYFASFQLNGISVESAYNNGGELVGTSRKIDIDQVPMAVSLELAKKYGDYTIASHAYELNFEGQTSYYVNVQDNKQLLSLKCESNGEISVEKRARK